MRSWVIGVLVALAVGVSTQGCVAMCGLIKLASDHRDQSWRLVGDVELHGARLGWIRVDFADGGDPHHLSVLLPTVERLALRSRVNLPAVWWTLGWRLFGSIRSTHVVGNGEAQLGLRDLYGEWSPDWRFGAYLALILPAEAFDLATLPLLLPINLVLLAF